MVDSDCVQPLCSTSEDTSTTEWIDKILSRLKWTRQHLLTSETQKLSCPGDAGHIMSRQSLERHVNYCILQRQGYTRDDLDSDQSTKFFYEKSSTVVSVDLDDQTLRNLLGQSGGRAAQTTELPRTMHRAMIDLTAAQRLHIYKHCVEVSRAADRPDRLTEDGDLSLLPELDKNAGQPQSKLELMAQLRDLKRRRQSYKGKNTHTSKRSHNEVIREVIMNQTDILRNIWEEERKEKEKLKRIDNESREHERAKEDCRHSADKARAMNTSSDGRSRETTKRKTSRSRSRGTISKRSRSSDKDKRRRRDKGRSRSKDTTSRRSRDTASRSRDKDRRRSRSREKTDRTRSRSQSRQKPSNGDRCRSRDRGNRKTKSRRSRSTNREKDRSRSRSKHRANRRSRSQEKARSKSRDTTSRRSRSQEKDRSRSKSRNKVSKRSGDLKSDLSQRLVTDQHTRDDNKESSSEESRSSSRGKDESHGRTTKKKTKKSKRSHVKRKKERRKKHTRDDRTKVHSEVLTDDSPNSDTSNKKSYLSASGDDSEGNAEKRLKLDNSPDATASKEKEEAEQTSLEELTLNKFTTSNISLNFSSNTTVITAESTAIDELYEPSQPTDGEECLSILRTEQQ